MGFVLSILYFVTYYLTPTELFGPLAQYRIQLITAVLAMIVSIPAVIRSPFKRTSQTVALIGLAISTFLSILIGVRWLGGALQGFLGFIPNAFGYFLVVLHFNSIKKLKALVVMLVFVCVLVTIRGGYDMARVAATETPIAGGATDSPYAMAQRNSNGDWIFRLMGLGEINDPNDFAQLIVCTVPLLFVFWQRKHILASVALIVPVFGVLLTGLYLTHSRGGIVALAAVIVMGFRRRIGTVLSAVLGGALVVAAIALNATGGRDISAEAGSDRTSLWGEGLQILKTHPLFGVGLGQFPDYTGGLTAHNTVVVCAAELGMIGLFFWTWFLLPSVRDIVLVAAPVKERKDPDEVVNPFVQRTIESSAPIGSAELVPAEPDLHQEQDAEIKWMGLCVLLSITGFLVAGWFLSRALVVTLFVLGGMAEVLFQMALERGLVSPRLTFRRTIGYAAILSVALVLIMYVLLRITNLTR
jgi:O-Antigen ligase